MTARVLAICLAALVAAPVHAAELTLDEIVWPGMEAYCRFMRAGHEFKFDDPATWRFVFFSNLPRKEGRDPIETPFVSIDGRLTQLVQTGMETTGFETTRRYVAKTDPETAVEVYFKEKDSGEESTAYEGAIKAERAGASATVEFTGDCGV